MEVFSVFATMSLVDLLSNPLERINKKLKGVDGSVSGLGKRMGALTMSMLPVALATGVMLAGFGSCVSVAAGFEDQMAKVGAVSRASAGEMSMLEAKARELGATTQFTASQVAEAEMYLGMAGFTAAQNIAALPGVLDLAAATATDLGRAADISSDILSAFGLRAEEMSRVADVLALTCSTANTNMEMLGDTMKYVAPVARMAGLSLEETSAMAGLLANIGIKGSMAGTSMKTMLNKMAAPTKEASETLAELGIVTKDAAGNLRSPIAVLGEMAKKLEGMGSAQQIAAMKTIVGEEAIAGFSELIKQEGIGAITKYADVLNGAGGSAAEMARRMNDTLAGSCRNLGSAWESVQITVGQFFIPAVRAAVDGITAFLQSADKAAQNPFGAFLIKLVAGIGAAIVAITALSGAIWFLTVVGPLLGKVFTPLKAAIVGISAPMWAIIAVIGALYLAYKTNFAGIADTLNGWWKTMMLVGRGVLEVFRTLKDGTGEIRGELATEIKAAGLTGFVTTVSRAVFRVRAALLGFRDAFTAAMHKVNVILVPVRIAVAELMMYIGELFGTFDGSEVDSSVSAWTRFGETLGEIAGGVVTGLAYALDWVITVLGWLAAVVSLVIDGVAGLVNWFRDLSGASTEAVAAADPWSWQTLGQWIGYAAGAVLALKGAMLFCKGVMLATSGVMKVWAAAMWLVNAALSANPVVLIIIAIIALIAAIVALVQNWDWICQKWDEVWAYVGGVIGPIWDGIQGTITSVWQSIVDRVVSVGQTLWSGLEALWDSIVLGAQESWDSLVSSVSGLGQRVSTALSEMWAGVMDFFSKIDLFESGAKLLDTFTEGIKSKISSLVSTVENALASVREYLPFSDAHTGPLSQLTLSGTRMMTTLGEGVGQGAPGLVQSVSGALDKAGAAIGGWWAKLTGAEQKMTAGIPEAPIAPAQAVVFPPQMPKIPELSLDISTPGSPDIAVPEIPKLCFANPQMPKLPELSLDVSTPDSPDIAVDERQSLSTKEGRQSERAAQQSWTVTIHELHLPNVEKSEDFAAALIGEMEQYGGA